MPHSKLKTGFALVLLAASGAVGSVAFAGGDKEPKCNCWWHETNEYGVGTVNDCPKVDCWNPIDGDTE